MTIAEVKAKAKFICKHNDPTGVPIEGYYDELEDVYYITYEAKHTRDNKEYVTSKKACDIKSLELFDPFSEIKLINGSM